MVAGALRADDLALVARLRLLRGGRIALILSLREPAASARAAATTARCCSTSVAGMVVLAGANNLVTLFLGNRAALDPALRAVRGRSASAHLAGVRAEVPRSIGSVGSATLLYGLAFVYGATGSTDFAGIARAIGDGGIAGDPLFLTGIALAAPDSPSRPRSRRSTSGRPTCTRARRRPMTAFMAVATKAAAFAIILRFFDVAVLPAKDDWDAALAALAAPRSSIGNVGAIGQDSMKRLLAYSGVAQAGYMLAGVVVGTALGLKSVVFYLSSTCS